MDTIINNHRAYPPPTTPYVMVQRWNNLLFAHWPLPPEVLRQFLPPELPLDIYEGQAWVGVVPFWMSNVHLKGLPPIPFTSKLAELNVRTYVNINGRPGVFFLSLDADNPLAVAAARVWYHLRYFNAKMQVQVENDNVNYCSRRTHTGYPHGELKMSYRPLGPKFTPQPGTLVDWLTSRYCLYAVDRRQRVYRGEIHHEPWTLQNAEADFKLNTVAASWGIELPDIPPLLHYSQRLDMVAWPIERIF